VLYGAAALSRSDRWKKGCPAPTLGTITARPRKTDQKEDGVDRGPDKPKPKRGSAFEKLQSEREAKGVEEDLERAEFDPASVLALGFALVGAYGGALIGKLLRVADTPR
jgi:hypothetical protein